MNNRINRIALTASLITTLTAAVSAEQNMFDKNETIKNPKEMLKEKAGKSMHTAGRLVGSALYGTGGKELGEIEEIVLSPDLQEIRHIILASGGFLGFGEKSIALSLDTIEFNKQKKRLEADISQQTLETIPEFTPADESSTPLLTRLNGRNVVNRQGKMIGELEASTISLKHGKLNFALIAGDNSDKLQGKTIVVPWNALSFNADGDLSVDADQKQIESVAFKRENVPFLGDLRFGEHIYNRFGEDPYWPPTETDEVWYGGLYYGYWPYMGAPGIYYY